MISQFAYGELSPVPELNQWIAAYWHFKVDEGVVEVQHVIPPNGGVMLAILPNRTSVFSGPQKESQTVVVRGGMTVCGAMFWPGTASSFLNVEMQSLLSPGVPASDVFSKEASDRLAKLTTHRAIATDLKPCLDDFFLALVSNAKPLDNEVMKLVFRIIRSNGQSTVQQMVEGMSVSARQLRRRFRQQVGLSPKELLRVQRLRSCAKESVNNPNVSWVELAARLGYSDQAHLIREFRRIMGMTPSQFEAHFHAIEHEGFVR